MWRFALPALAMTAALLALFAGALGDLHTLPDSTEQVIAVFRDASPGPVSPPPTAANENAGSAEHMMAQDALQQQIVDLQRQASALRDQLNHRDLELAQRTRDLDAAQVEIARHKQDLAQRVQELAQRTHDLDAARAARNTAVSAGDALRHQIADLQQQASGLQTQITQQGQTLTQRTHDLDAAQAEIVQRRQELAQRTQDLAQRTHDLEVSRAQSAQAKAAPEAAQPGAITAEQQAAREALQRQLDDLQRQASTLQLQLARSNQQLVQRTRDLDAAQAAMAQHKQELAQRAQDFAQRGGDLDAARAEIAQNHKQLDQRTQELAQRSHDLDATRADADRLHQTLDALRQQRQQQLALAAPAHAAPARPAAPPPPPSPPAVPSQPMPAPALQQLQTARQWLAAGRPDEARRMLAMVQTQMVFQPVTADQPTADGGNASATEVGEAIRWLDMGATGQAMQAITHAIDGANAARPPGVRAWSGYAAGAPPGYVPPPPPGFSNSIDQH